jgi:hypothetical protein
MKCLGMGVGAPSRRERCDRSARASYYHGRWTKPNATDHTVAFLRRHPDYGGQDRTGFRCHFPGISCLATFLYSLRDNQIRRMLYQALQMWQLNDAVLFICFVLVSVEALSFGRSTLPNIW